MAIVIVEGRGGGVCRAQERVAVPVHRDRVFCRSSWRKLGRVKLRGRAICFANQPIAVPIQRDRCFRIPRDAKIFVKHDNQRIQPTHRVSVVIDVVHLMFVCPVTVCLYVCLPVCLHVYLLVHVYLSWIVVDVHLHVSVMCPNKVSSCGKWVAIPAHGIPNDNLTPKWQFLWWLVMIICRFLVDSWLTLPLGWASSCSLVFMSQTSMTNMDRLVARIRMAEGNGCHYWPLTSKSWTREGSGSRSVIL